MKVCSHCKVKKDDASFRPRVDKRSNPHTHYLNNQCIECDNKRANAYYAKKKDDPAFREKNRQRVKRYAESNVDKIKERKKKPEWLRKHADWNMKSYYRMREVIAAKMRIKRKTDEYKKFIKEYRNRNKDKIHKQEVITKRRYHEKHRDNVTDEYVIRQLITQGVADRNSVTPEIIQAKRLQLLIKRKIKNHGN